MDERTARLLGNLLMTGSMAGAPERGSLMDITPGMMLAAVPIKPASEQSRAGPLANAPKTMRLTHGTDLEGLEELRPGTRGALGPAVYGSDNFYTPRRYGKSLYEFDVPTDQVFHGMSRPLGDDVNPYEVYRDQTARLVNAAPPDKRMAVADATRRYGPDEGYQLYRNMENIFGEAAHEPYKAAGYKGITGYVDGPEYAMFNPVRLGSQPHHVNDEQLQRIQQASGLSFDEISQRYQPYKDLEGDWKYYSPIEKMLPIARALLEGRR